jgi:orotidine-5'-phosphate decarboxylase
VNSPSPENRIIVALDVPDEAAAFSLIERIGARVGYFKVGLQLFTKAGPQIVRRIHGAGAKVFLDLKFHDIPNTVRHAVESAAGLGAQMLTIHLSGGAKMVRAAADAAEGSGVLILGVTVLTSSSETTLRETGVADDVGGQVARLASLARDNGIRGLVASPLEAPMLREQFGGHFTIVTPGVRPAWAEANDQQRMLTPAEAVRAGADFLVIGRPITAHADPAEAVAQIAAELSGG